MVQDVNVMHVPPSTDFDIVGSIELSTIKLSLKTPLSVVPRQLARDSKGACKKM